MSLQVPVIVKVPMVPFQSVLYNWVKASGTIRLDPDGALASRTLRTFVPLNNKCMELRKVCFGLATGVIVKVAS